VSEGLQKRGSRWSDAPVLSYGFRIFFLLSAVSAIGLIATWLAVLLGLVWLGTIPAHLWHAHEMLFGVVAAAMAGFLLTAVPSWTGTPAVAGPRLFALALLWTIGRIASLPVFATSMFAAGIDIAFLPALGASLAAPLIAQGKLRNAVFLVLLAGLAMANLLFRLEWMGVTADSAHSGISLAVGIVLLMITVIGGRIIPAFTQNALRQQRPDFVIRTRPLLDRATILLTIVMIVLDMLARQSMTHVAVTAAACLAHGLRLAGWKSRLTLSQPLLWILHLAYAWIPIGLALKVADYLGFEWASGWLHAITIGAFTTMILAVSSRAALGHTGRPLIATKLTIAAFVLISLAAVLRIAVDALPAAFYLPVLAGSAASWIMAFALWLWVYAPILWGRRLTGQLAASP